MFLQSKILFNSLIRFSEHGIEIASYTQIREAFTNRYKAIYGTDIDVSTSSADGQYIEMQCLIISNILQSFKALYSNLDVNTAQGKLLDILCTLTNVTRKQAINSRASIRVATLSGTLTVGPNEPINYIQFLDKAGNTWSYRPTSQVTFTTVPSSIVVVSDLPGPVRADIGWIDKVVDMTLNLSVSQEDAAEIGAYEESDYQLRARRNQSIGSSGITVIQSLVGALLSIEGIDDVEIYNNDTTSAITAKDATSIPAHSVYAIIRKRSLIDIPDATIGTLLYEKMTPGIHYVATSETYGNSKSYQYVQKSLGVPISAITQTVNWKEAIAIQPAIQIKITKASYVNDDINAFSDKVLPAISAKLLKYLNELHLSTDIMRNDLLIQTQLADPLYKGLPSFSVDFSTILINGQDEDYVNEDTYFDYTDVSIEDITDDVITLRIS